MDWIIALIALTSMEIVLGIDNVVFIAILVGKLPENQRNKARTIGLALALVLRIILLLSIKWIMGLTEPVVDLSTFGAPESWGEEILEISWKDLILFGGGLFLIANSVKEIHKKIEGPEESDVKEITSFGAVLFQIAVLDVIFSLDSVITAVGMAEHIEVMIAAVTVAIIVMMIFAGAISRFIERHATLKVLALSFLILIGVMLIMEGLGQHINKGYIYFAMAFSFVVEMINLRIRIVAQKLRARKEEKKEASKVDPYPPVK